MERNYRQIIILFQVILGACLLSCQGNKQASVISYENIPTPIHNPMDQQKVDLGKKLFFDPNLSKDSTISCASCHKANFGFAENVALSTKGVSHKQLKRNSPTLINVAWAKGWFWDGGAKNIESLVFGPLTHEDEMGVNLKQLIHNLNQDKIYKNEFNKVFNTNEIHSAHVGRALAQYVRTLISNTSNYDKYLIGEYQYNKEELKGFKVFQAKCNSCHTAPFFTDFDYHNNGLDTFYPDTLEGIYKGRGRITRDEKDIGKYKTPTLRNLFASAPYMHDGRFSSINEVLDHYTMGIKKSQTLDSTLIDRILLSDEDKKNLVSFLKTLTDSNFLEIKKSYDSK